MGKFYWKINSFGNFKVTNWFFAQSNFVLCVEKKMQIEHITGSGYIDDY